MHETRNALHRLTKCIDTFLTAGEEDQLKVLIYVDEAETLTGSTGELDWLMSAISRLHKYSLFVVFLSTQSQIFRPQVRPSPGVAFPASARMHSVPVPHAPITETPFDQFGDKPLIPSLITVDDLGDVVFMSLFGRPM